MDGLALSAVGDLRLAGNARRSDNYIFIGAPNRREEFHLANLHREFVMFGLVAKRALPSANSSPSSWRSISAPKTSKLM